MKCEILSVGTELLLGHTINTDASSLSELLGDLGINVYWHSVVGDNPARLRDSVAVAKSRADIIITTGGLGPTYDDLTKNVLAECFGKELVFHPDIDENNKRWFAQHRPGEYTDNNRQQAYLPEGCTVFQNDWGTAPGCAFYAEGVHVIMLPGPPRECLPLFRHCAAPYLMSLSDGVLVSRKIRVFGMGESAIESLLREKMETMSNPTLATYAKEGEVMLRVTAKAETEEDATAMCAPVEDWVRQTLGDYVYGVDVDSLEALTLSLMTERHMTLSAAESLTGGLIGARFTALPGASAVFKGGAITYCDEVKSGMLGIDPALLEKFGAVSSETAAAMAQGVREAAGADIAVSATGLAGPDGDGIHPVGTVFVGMAAEGNVWVRPLHIGGGRSRIRAITVNNAYDMVRRYLTDLPIVVKT